MTTKPGILLFSTLNPYPFWAGSENFWFDFVKDETVNKAAKFHIALADSPVTRNRAVALTKVGATVSFYKHFNTHFTRRNLYRIADRIKRRKEKTIPWYNEIKNNKYDLVWFNAAALNDLYDLSYAMELCKKTKTPYWIILQHGAEDFFLTSKKEIDIVTEVATRAKRFIFISKRNRVSLERAIGRQLDNAFHSVNAIPASAIEQAFQLDKKNAINKGTTRKFFNLGRFSPRDKAQHLLLEAFSNAKWKDREWQLSFIGVSDFGEIYLKKLIHFYKLDLKKIKIMSHIDNVLEEIVKHDVLLMPSLSEGTPFAMVESMACGRPALGTPVGGIPELIIEKETGWLCKTTDIKDVAEKLEEAWQQASQWKEYGHNAQKHIEKNYNQDIAFARLLEVLREDMN